MAFLAQAPPLCLMCALALALARALALSLALALALAQLPWECLGEQLLAQVLVAFCGRPRFGLVTLTATVSIPDMIYDFAYFLKLFAKLIRTFKSFFCV